MRAPVLLILLAAAAAVVMALGTHPHLAAWPGGVELILLSRRLLWPLAVAALLLCIVLIVLVISGRRRAWWLIGLAPILGLFAYRFAADPFRHFAVMEHPQFIAAADAEFLDDEEYIVGLVFQGTAFAYPYSTLFMAPVVIQQDHDRRMMLIWSAFANRALAFTIGREIRPRELEIVSMPANALLLYNRRNGQFINGVTGKTPAGHPPEGIALPLATAKMPWAAWRELHPGTQVCLPPPHAQGFMLPTGPVLPQYPMRTGDHDLAPETRITFIASDEPVALRPEVITDKPLNLVSGRTPILLLRQGDGGRVMAFDRRLEADLSPRFVTASERPRGAAGNAAPVGMAGRSAALVDLDTDSGWTAAGLAVTGSRRGQQLEAIAVEEDVYWGVMKLWHPRLHLYSPD